MKTIWKFPLNVTDEQTVAMPEGAAIIAIQAQRDVPCVWALVDSEAAIVRRTFRIVGTGHEVNLPDNSLFAGTFQLHEGALVFHVFAVPS